MVGGMGSGLVSLFIGMVKGDLLSRNQLTLVGAIPPGSARPYNVKASKRETRKHGYYTEALQNHGQLLNAYC